MERNRMSTGGEGQGKHVKLLLMKNSTALLFRRFCLHKVLNRWLKGGVRRRKSINIFSFLVQAINFEMDI